jgi:hypothetical protein
MGTNVTQQQLDSACGSKTKLPAGLQIKPCSAATVAEVNPNGTGRQTGADQARFEGPYDCDPPSRISIEVPPSGAQQDAQ